MSSIRFMNYNDDYHELSKENDRLQIVYGAGAKGKYISKLLPKVDFICDKNAENINKGDYENNLITPCDLQNLKSKMDILICIQKKEVREEIKRELLELEIDARIFDAYENIAFDWFIFNDDTRKKRTKEKIEYVRIVDGGGGWILSKFALRMKEALTKKGIHCEIGITEDENADMNYFPDYSAYQRLNGKSINATFMIAHINCIEYVEKVKYCLKTGLMGICMSKETMEKLVSLGVPRERLCYINPAQDGIMKPKKYVLGITHRCYDQRDHRKRTSALLDIVKDLDPDFFEFKIMGAGWELIIEQLRQKGFQVTYYPDFNMEVYLQLMPTLDYYLFWGFDEGSMGYLDALAAGVKTIVTPQGFHLDVKNGITYPCRTINDFAEVLLSLEMERKKIISSVEEWTWDRFAEKHIEVWNYLLGIDEDNYKNQHKYEDGIFSVFPAEIRI